MLLRDDVEIAGLRSAVLFDRILVSKRAVFALRQKTSARGEKGAREVTGSNG